MTNNFRIVVDKLSKYSSRYWSLQLVQGLLLLITVLIFLITVVFSIEYLFYTAPYFKISLFVAVVLTAITIFIKRILKPALYCSGLLQFSALQAAGLVTEHFPELKDHLINIVELGESGESNLLVSKSIDQKLTNLPVFGFKQYFNIRLVIKYLLALFFSLCVTSLCYFSFPGFFMQAGFRLMHMSQHFSKPAPFSFELKNTSLKVLKGGSLEVEVACVGDGIPENVYVNIGGENFIMENGDGVFKYQLNNIQSSFSVFFTDLYFVSDQYHIEVIPDPLILGYSVSLIPPAYTKLQKQVFADVTSFEVPFGSQLQWDLSCADVDSVIIMYNTDKLTAVDNNKGEFKVNQIIKESGIYKVYACNEYIGFKELLTFTIDVVRDEFPGIDVYQIRDSLDLTRFYFKGKIMDDYGFNNLTFNLRYGQNDSVVQLSILPNITSQAFYYAIDFNEFSGLSDSFSYYFVVSDNDSSHGFKKSSSDVFSFSLPSFTELTQQEDSLYEDVENFVDDSRSLLEQMKEEFEEFKYRNISQNLNEWDQQQFMKKMLDKKNELENSIKQIRDRNSQLNNLQNSFSEQKQDLLEKQKQIDDLLKEVMNDELKKLFDELNELANEFNKDRFNDLMDRLDFPMEDMAKQLDRNLEMLKRYKIEQEIESIISEVNEIAESENRQGDRIHKDNLEEIRDKELENQSRMNDLANKLSDLQQTNGELDKPMKLYPMSDEFEGVDQNYNQIKKDLGEKKTKKAQEGISKNRDKLLNMAFSLQQMLNNNQMASAGENIENLKQILKNLVFLSLEQEEVLNLSQNLSVSDPSLKNVQYTQELLEVQSKQVEDSLYALASRTPAVSSKVNSELSKIDFSLKRSLDDLKEADFGSAVNFQQNAITAFNELALLLNEALENLEKMMANAMPGDQECDKPGGRGKGSMSKLKDAQQSLKDQLQRMIEGIKNGDQGKLGQQVGKSLMQQEMLKQMISDMILDDRVGSSAKEQLRAINQLIEQNRLDLLNKNLDERVINRQNLILDHLLKAEKAEMERELDDTRESTTAEQKFYSNPESVFEYKEEEKNKVEDLRFNSVRMRKFYEDKYRNYINKVNQ